jgi:hypothetical protein
MRVPVARESAARRATRGAVTRPLPVAQLRPAPGEETRPARLRCRVRGWDRMADLGSPRYGGRLARLRLALVPAVAGL